MTRQATSFRDVEVRTWPQRTDVLIIDPYEAVSLAHFPLLDPAPGKVADLHCGYDRRARRAINQLEADQDYLRTHYRAGENEEVRLRPVSDVRDLMSALLAEHDLTLEELEFPLLRAALEKLSGQDTGELYELMCDWHDVVERHMNAGVSAKDPDSWVHRATPLRAMHFHHLAVGVTSREHATAADTADAYDMFEDLINVELSAFTFGHALRWVYFHRTEFPEHEPFELSALRAAGI